MTKTPFIPVYRSPFHEMTETYVPHSLLWRLIGTKLVESILQIMSQEGKFTEAYFGEVFSHCETKIDFSSAELT